VALAGRVERCRQLVISARGIGAELALARFVSLHKPLDLDALEGILAPRCRGADAAAASTSLEAILYLNPRTDDLTAFTPCPESGERLPP
jgi:hypothetical protein